MDNCLDGKKEASPEGESVLDKAVWGRWVGLSSECVCLAPLIEFTR